ncbi:MAG: septation regulator SpoVG [Lachnospiraceae bacterium]|nr:septation regulator SpoVG [Lachnospiraceae bacterium]
MEITDVRVRKLTNTGKMRALVSVTLDDAFVVHDIKVIEGEKGLFIAMPSRKASDGVFRDIAHPINTETRNNMQRLILERYMQSLDEPDDVEHEEVIHEEHIGTLVL